MKSYKIRFSAEVDLEAETQAEAESDFINLSGSLKDAPIENIEIMEAEENK